MFCFNDYKVVYCNYFGYGKHYIFLVKEYVFLAGSPAMCML